MRQAALFLYRESAAEPSMFLGIWPKCLSERGSQAQEFSDCLDVHESISAIQSITRIRRLDGVCYGKSAR
jgi:hypothetical protein